MGLGFSMLPIVVPLVFAMVALLAKFAMNKTVLKQEVAAMQLL